MSAPQQPDLPPAQPPAGPPEPQPVRIAKPYTGIPVDPAALQAALATCKAGEKAKDKAKNKAKGSGKAALNRLLKLWHASTLFDSRRL